MEATLIKAVPVVESYKSIEAVERGREVEQGTGRSVRQEMQL